MTTKEIREKLAIYTELPRTNKFKRAVDLALAQDLPISIHIAGPFKGYQAIMSNGKTASFKVKIKNTKTGQCKLFARCFTEKTTDWKSGVYRGYICSASSFEQINKMIIEKYPDVNFSNVKYTHTGDHSFDKVDGSFSWSKFALCISELFKKDFAHTSPCGKCSGSGFLPHYAHIDNGVCWDCCGSGYHLLIGDEMTKQVA